MGETIREDCYGSIKSAIQIYGESWGGSCPVSKGRCSHYASAEERFGTSFNILLTVMRYRLGLQAL